MSDSLRQTIPFCRKTALCYLPLPFNTFFEGAKVRKKCDPKGKNLELFQAQYLSQSLRFSYPIWKCCSRRQHYNRRISTDLCMPCHHSFKMWKIQSLILGHCILAGKCSQITQ